MQQHDFDGCRHRIAIAGVAYLPGRKSDAIFLGDGVATMGETSQKPYWLWKTGVRRRRPGGPNYNLNIS